VAGKVALNSSLEQLAGWTPIRVYNEGSRFMVDWAFLGELRFTDPFFEQTVGRCLRHPASLLFRHQTTIETLGDFAALHPGLKPSGFIFHMSRCGSTLIPQMLTAVPRNLALSEPGPVDGILRAHFRMPDITEQQRIPWLQGMVSALGQPRHGEENYIIKFDSWHALFLPTILRAFPDVPWIFLYRNPVEVMVSQHIQRGAQMVPGLIQPELFGMRTQELPGLSLDDYCSCVLESICKAALAAASSGHGMLINYRQLPEEIWPALMRHWKLRFSTEETKQMFEATKLYAKNPHLPYEDDTAAKQAQATDEIKNLCRERLDGLYLELEKKRTTS
jgi:hypothetical protein